MTMYTDSLLRAQRHAIIRRAQAHLALIGPYASPEYKRLRMGCASKLLGKAQALTAQLHPAG